MLAYTTYHNELRCLQDEQDKHMIAVREKFGDRLESFAEEIKALVKLARTYVGRKRKSILGDRQSCETALSYFGYQKSKPSLRLQKGWTEIDAIKALRESKRHHLIATAIVTKESLNRGALANLTNDELFEIGLERKQTERFFVEPKQDQGQRATA